MTDLVEFLKARLDEDEQVARSLLRMTGWETIQLKTSVTTPDGVERSEVRTIPDPQRMLREVEAKRGLILLYQEAWAAIGKGPVAVAAAAVVRRDTLHRAVAAFASAWRDHPDYREGWAPASARRN